MMKLTEFRFAWYQEWWNHTTCHFPPWCSLTKWPGGNMTKLSVEIIRHHGDLIVGTPEIHRTIAVISYWDRRGAFSKISSFKNCAHFWCVNPGLFSDRLTERSGCGFDSCWGKIKYTSFFLSFWPYYICWKCVSDYGHSFFEADF